MKIKLILDINKNEFSQLNYIVTGRIGDKASNTVDVYIIDGGAPYPLTGLSVFYECLKPDNKFVRDSNGIKIIDAAKGHFEYTFPAQVFTAHGKTKRSFFSIEKDTTVRATTQDFVLVTLQDAATGNIQSDQYISDLEKLIAQANGIIKRIKDLETQAQGIIDKEITDLRNKANSLLKENQNNADKIIAGIQTNATTIKKQLDDLQQTLNKMDVVNKSGGTMTGNLVFNKTNTGLIFRDGLNLDTGLLTNADGKQIYMKDWKRNKVLFSNDDSGFNVFADNLLKKTGDTMTGHIQLDRVNSTDVRYVQYKLGSVFEYSVGVNKQGKYHLYDHANSATVFEYDPLTKAFTMLSNANLLKKTGDVMTGPLKVKIDASNASTPIAAETLDGSIRLLPWSVANYIQSGTLDGEAKDLIISGTSAKKIDKVQVIAKEFIVEGKVNTTQGFQVNGKEQVPSNVAVWFSTDKTNFNNGDSAIPHPAKPRWGYNRQVDHDGNGIFTFKESGLHQIDISIVLGPASSGSEHMLKVALLGSAGNFIEMHEVVGDTVNNDYRWTRLNGSLMWQFAKGEKIKVLYRTDSANPVQRQSSKISVKRVSAGLDEQY